MKGMTQNARRPDFLGYGGRGCIEISAPGAFTELGFFDPEKKPRTSAAERGRLRDSKTLDDVQR